jgi:hypothetical protein
MLKKFEPFEPVRDGRFILKMIGYGIPEWLVRSYRFYNDGDKLMMDVKVIEAEIFVINPTKLFDIEGIDLTFLDPTGVEYLKHTFAINGINFEHISDYSVNDLSSYQFVFEIDKASYKTIEPKEKEIKK